MSVFKKLFGKFADVPFEELAQDDGQPMWDRAVRIADAANRGNGPARYLHFRDGQLHNMELALKSAMETDDIVKPLREATEKHLQELKQLAQEGDEALLKREARLQAAGTGLSQQRTEVLKILQSKLKPLRDLTKTFNLLAEAEKLMPNLPAPEKNHIPEALVLLSGQDDKMMKHGVDLTLAGKDAETAIKNARDSETTRANKQREAATARQAGERRVKFNEYLKSGLSTGAPVSAPKTARFTRKPKTVKAP